MIVVVTIVIVAVANVVARISVQVAIAARPIAQMNQSNVFVIKNY